ncbi:sugar O-acetyltransferase [Zymomonas mobilis]|uniref:sugar O-acetyltransferase n=1 Tax=Zymomonas mobilis TaxID=542 RepID=UPI0021C377D7|nr:sugar O-acetyltransferase [Zymomonas mobilis]MCP9308303.1 sugar O-acetyltransferase [Zymomonas mobilis]
MDIAQQRQHILSGAYYNDLTPELIKAREEAVRLSNLYNDSFGEAPAKRESYLRQLLKKIGNNAYFEPRFRCEFGFNISIGDNFYANFDCIILDGGEVTIGDNVLFGPRVGIYTSNHAINPDERKAGACYAKAVTIGHSVWVGGGVNINQGVTIGDNSIIGSGSVVTKDIPANVIAAGVPCRVIRPITDADRVGFNGS